MNGKLAAVLMAALLMITGCGDAPEKGGSRTGDKVEIADASGDSAVSQGDGQVIDGQTYRELAASTPPGYPIWEDGVVYSDEVRRTTILVRSAVLEAIYFRARERMGEDLRGMMSVRFVIEPDGHLSRVDLVNDWWSDDRAAALTDSMMSVIEQWTFPPGAEKPIAVTQPFKFEPRPSIPE